MDQNHGNSLKTINWKKRIIWISIVLGSVILVLVIGGIILQSRLPNQLKTSLHKETKGVYQLEFDKMDISLLTGFMRLENLNLIPDSIAYFKDKNSKDVRNLFQIQAASLEISGLNILKLIFNKKIQASSITINKPNVVMMRMADTVNKDSSAESLYEKIPDLLKNVKLKLLRINELSFIQQEKGDTVTRGSRLSGINLALESINIDSLSYSDSTTFWFCKDIRMYSKNVQIVSADGMYKFTVGDVKLSVKGRILEIVDLKVIPQYPEIEFSQRLGKQGDRYQIVVPKTTAKEINFKKLEREGRLGIASLNIQNAEMRIFNNKTLPESGIVKAENFPNIAMKRLGIQLTLDTLLMKNFAVYYKELSPKSGKSGTVFFTNLYGTLHNVTNDSLQYKSDPWCRASFQTNFLGKTKLLVDLNLNMSDRDGEFNYSGSFGEAKGRFYNQLLEPMAMARIEDGIIHKIGFSVNANRYGSTANVLMLYDNLKVNVLGKDGKVLKKKGLLSFLANNFLVKNSNPRKEGESPVDAKISYLHPQERSFFNLMWKSIFKGLKVNLGIPDLKK